MQIVINNLKLENPMKLKNKNIMIIVNYWGALTTDKPIIPHHT